MKLFASGLALLVLCSTSLVAKAQSDFFDKSGTADEMMYRVDRSRSRQAWLAIGVLGGAALVTAGTGLLFHLSGTGQADKIEAKTRTGRLWGEREQGYYDSAVFRRGVGWVGYGLAGGFAIATAVTWIVTDPGTKMIRVNADGNRPSASVDVVPGGAILRARTSF